MKAGYTIQNWNVSKEDKFILVYNYHNTNHISNMPYHDKTTKSTDEIGVWILNTKIK